MIRCFKDWHHNPWLLESKLRLWERELLWLLHLHDWRERELLWLIRLHDWHLSKWLLELLLLQLICSKDWHLWKLLLELHLRLSLNHPLGLKVFYLRWHGKLKRTPAWHARLHDWLCSHSWLSLHCNLVVWLLRDST